LINGREVAESAGARSFASSFAKASEDKSLRMTMGVNP